MRRSLAAGLLILVMAACTTQPERTTAPLATSSGSSAPTTLGVRADAALTGTVVGPDGKLVVSRGRRGRPAS